LKLLVLLSFSTDSISAQLVQYIALNGTETSCVEKVLVGVNSPTVEYFRAKFYIFGHQFSEKKIFGQTKI